jgi:hypothetical protein
MEIVKTARILNKAKKTLFDRLEFRTTSGNRETIDLAPSVIDDKRLLKKCLLDADADLPRDKARLDALLEGIGSSAPGPAIVYAAKTGWTKDFTGYVRLDKVIGNVSGNIVGFRRSNPSDPRWLIERSGSIKSWARSIAKPAEASSILMFAISAAFASPLLKIAGRGTFGFCLFAPSRTEKTLATLYAGSVVGLGSTEQLLAWNVTEARLGEQMPEVNDSLAPIDDLMALHGDDKTRYSRMRELAYKLALGAGTGRHSSFSPNSYEHWKVIVLTSNEHSIREFARRSRRSREPGETIRWIDLPATFDGADTIFDRITYTKEQLVWDQWFNRCKENQGHAFEAFLRRLIGIRETAPQLIEKYVNAFRESAQDDADGRLARDLATKFGLVYAGGRLAIQFGLVPWSKVVLKDAIKKCYRAARDLLPDEGVILRSGRDALLTYCKRLPKLKGLQRATCGSLEGLTECRRHYHRCLIKCEKFNSIFATTFQAELVIKWLIADKRVSMAKTETDTVKMKDQHFWPDGQRRRSLEIFWGDGRPGLTKRA